MAPGTVRAAVAGQLPLLLPLLDAAEPEVRRTAAWAVSHTRATALVLPALRRRWAEEAEPLVRAEILSGISRLDPQAGAVAAATVLDPSQPAGIRMAAVFACLDAGSFLYRGASPRRCCPCCRPIRSAPTVSTSIATSRSRPSWRPC